MMKNSFAAGRRLYQCHVRSGFSTHRPLAVQRAKSKCIIIPTTSCDWSFSSNRTRSSLMIRPLYNSVRVVVSRSQFNTSLNFFRQTPSSSKSMNRPVRFLSSFSQPRPPSQEEEEAQQGEKGNTPTTTTTTTEKSRRNSSRSRRQRHNFLSSSSATDLENVPSFAEFQQQVRVKSLYRQYLRLFYQKFVVSASSSSSSTTCTDNNKSSRDEMIAQVRHEFKSNNNSTNTMSPWDVKRAMSEGSRRFKELSSMLGNSVVVVNDSADDENDDDDDDSQVRVRGSSSTASSSSLDSSGKSPWPWQQQQDQQEGIKEPRRPWFPPYPSKSGL